jgi:hypothetical protein
MTLIGVLPSFNHNTKMKIEPFEPAIWIKTFIIMIFTFLEIRWEVTSLLAGLIMLDTITGVLKVTRLNLGFRISELYWGLTTKMFILLVPHLIALIGKILGLDWIYLVNLIIYVMIANDFTSILSNILSVKNKRVYRNFDFITLLFNHIKEFLRKTVEDRINNTK